jgi:hypothetical protein
MGQAASCPQDSRGFWLTFTASVGALAALAFGAVTQDVAGHDGMAVHDPHVTAWMVAHRAEWLTGVLRVVTWLGSTAVIIPLGVIAGGFFVLRRRRWQPLALLAAAVAGAVGLYDIVKPLIGRPRPPPAIWIGHYSGAAFPSGHATQSVAFYAMLAIVLGGGRPPWVKTLLWSVAALVVLAVGGSRIYLGAHWLTDVLAVMRSVPAGLPLSLSSCLLSRHEEPAERNWPAPGTSHDSQRTRRRRGAGHRRINCPARMWLDWRSRQMGWAARAP